MSINTKTKKSYTPPKIVENENVIGEAAEPTPGGMAPAPVSPMPAPSPAPTPAPPAPVAPAPSY